MSAYSFSVCRTNEADGEMIRQVFSLWEDTFHDEESFISFMLFKTLKNALLFTAENEAGKLCSMFFLSDIGYYYDGRCYPAYYLYAAATLLCERKKGLYSALYDYAENILLKKHTGPFFITLVPQTEALFGFYKRYGFQKRIYRNYFSVYPDPSVNHPYRFEKCDCNSNELYEAYLSKAATYKESIRKSKNFFGNSVSARLSFGYTVISVKKTDENRSVGYLMVKESKHSAAVTESYLKDADETTVSACLSAALSKKIYCRTQTCGTGKRIRPYGAVKAFHIDLHHGFCFADYLFD